MACPFVEFPTADPRTSALIKCPEGVWRLVPSRLNRLWVATVGETLCGSFDRLLPAALVASASISVPCSGCTTVVNRLEPLSLTTFRF